MGRKKNQAARRAAAKAKRDESVQNCTLCDSKTSLQTPCCDTYICGECIFESVYIHLGMTPVCYTYQCPLCAEEKTVSEGIVKKIMGDCYPSHAYIMRTCMGQEAMIVHLPCPSGCYRCDHSALEVRACD